MLWHHICSPSNLVWQTDLSYCVHKSEFVQWVCFVEGKTHKLLSQSSFEEIFFHPQILEYLAILGTWVKYFESTYEPCLAETKRSVLKENPWMPLGRHWLQNVFKALWLSFISYIFYPLKNFSYSCFQLKLLQTNNSYEASGEKKTPLPLHVDP